MRIDRGMIVALVAAMALGACAPATNGAGSRGPGETRFTTSAKLQLAQAEGAEGERRTELYQEALSQSLAGIESAPENAQHYYLAGIAHAGLGDFSAADEMWNTALEMYPEYGEDVMIAREQAWAQAFNDGVNAYNEGDMEGALRHWQAANEVFDRRPEAYFNLAAIYSQEERYDDAIGAFESAVAALERSPGRELTEEEVADREESLHGALQNLGNLQLFTEQFGAAERTFSRLAEMRPDDVQARANRAAALARQGQREQAMAVYQELLSMPGIDADQMMSVGIGMFQAQEYAEAANAFRRITEMQPRNRDAWYNYVNALYAEQRWQDVIPVAEQLLEMDPLNENAHLILIQAHREARQQQRALHFAEQNQAAPIHVDDIQVRQDNGRAVLTAAATGNRAAQGSPVRLQFTFYGPNGETLGTETATVSAPAQNASTRFEVAVSTQTMPIGFSYRLAQ
jgi:tetratricopeptide (TPR) repeat protein